MGLFRNFTLNDAQDHENEPDIEVNFFLKGADSPEFFHLTRSQAIHLRDILNHEYPAPPAEPAPHIQISSANIYLTYGNTPKFQP